MLKFNENKLVWIGGLIIAVFMSYVLIPMTGSCLLMLSIIALILYLALIWLLSQISPSINIGNGKF